MGNFCSNLVPKSGSAMAQPSVVESSSPPRMETAQSLWATWLSLWERSFSLSPPFSTSLVSFNVYCLLSYCCALLQGVFDPMKTPVSSALHFSDEVLSRMTFVLRQLSYFLWVLWYCGTHMQVGHERGNGGEQEGCWVSSQHSLLWRRVKPSSAGEQEKLYICLPWGCEVGDEFWTQGFRVPGMARGQAASGLGG